MKESLSGTAQGSASRTSLVDAMRGLDEMDFRVRGRSRHKASEIAVVTLCAIISGATSYYDIAGFAAERLDWLRGFGGLTPVHKSGQRPVPEDGFVRILLAAVLLAAGR